MRRAQAGAGRPCNTGQGGGRHGGRPSRASGTGRGGVWHPLCPCGVDDFLRPGAVSTARLGGAAYLGRVFRPGRGDGGGGRGAAHPAGGVYALRRRHPARGPLQPRGPRGLPRLQRARARRAHRPAFCARGGGLATRRHASPRPRVGGHDPHGGATGLHRGPLGHDPLGLVVRQRDARQTAGRLRAGGDELPRVRRRYHPSGYAADAERLLLCLRHRRCAPGTGDGGLFPFPHGGGAGAGLCAHGGRAGGAAGGGAGGLFPAHAGHGRAAGARAGVV
jgi:hypothetical protein